MLESKEYKFNSLTEAVEKFIEFKKILSDNKFIGIVKNYSLDLKTTNEESIINIKLE